MRRTPFPHCCGAYNLAYFPEAWDLENKRAVDRFAKALQRARKRWSSVTWDTPAFVNAILNERQWEVLGDIFLENNFRVVSEGRNGLHMSHLRLLVWTNPL